MKYIFIHGLGQNISSWNETLKGLDQKDNIECLDLIKLLDQQEINYQNLYQSFKEYCLQISEPIVLCGLSLGGILALQYALEYKERVNSLILIGVQYTMPKILLKCQNVVFRCMPKKSFQQIGFTKKDFISLCQSMIDIDLTHQLPLIQCFTYIICGKKDIFNKKACINLHQYLSNSKLIFIENAGHEVNKDQPKELARILNEIMCYK